MKTLVVKSELSKACSEALKCQALDNKTKLLLIELTLRLERSVTLRRPNKYH